MLSTYNAMTNPHFVRCYAPVFYTLDTFDKQVVRRGPPSGRYLVMAYTFNHPRVESLREPVYINYNFQPDYQATWVFRPISCVHEPDRTLRTNFFLDYHPYDSESQPATPDFPDTCLLRRVMNLYVEGIHVDGVERIRLMTTL